VHDLGARERPKPPARAVLTRHRPEIVVHGHSHRPGAARVGPTLFVNPGSAGPRRFSLPRTAAVLEVAGRTARVLFFDLSGAAPAPFGDPVEAAL
jgi:predicted phosphodiesterase